jgi:hypothetical protein
VIDSPFREDKSQVNTSGLQESGDPPLLEDLGIEPKKIFAKFLSIVTQRNVKEHAGYDDMAGPLLIFLVFGLLLFLVSKIS